MEGEELAQYVRGGGVWLRNWRKDHRCPHLVVVCSIVTQACSGMEEIETKVSDVKAQLGFLVCQVVCMLGEQHGFLDSPLTAFVSGPVQLSAQLVAVPQSLSPSCCPRPSGDRPCGLHSVWYV